MKGRVQNGASSRFVVHEDMEGCGSIEDGRCAAGNTPAADVAGPTQNNEGSTGPLLVTFA